MSLGLVMIAKVCFINEYNSCIADRERVYQLQTNFHRDREEGLMTFWNISGGVAPAMAAEIPEIECGTRMTMINGTEDRIILPDESRVRAHIWLADSCFFDVFGIRVLVGDPKQILSQQGHCMVSLALAEKLGGVEKAIGMTVSPDGNKSLKVTIDGVFETLPENCSLSFDMLASINFMPEWSRTNWLGNDRYNGFVKCRSTIDKDEMQKKMRAVQANHVDIAEVEQRAGSLYYTLTSMDDRVQDDESLQNMKWIMLLMGAAILIVSVLNYLVIVVSTLVNRTKQIAVEKCYGALFEDILRMTFCESIVHIGLALAMAAGLLYLIRPRAEELLDASLASVFSQSSLLIILYVCVALLLVTTFVPAIIFERVPVSAAFRHLRDAKRVWKLTLLFFQMVFTAVIVGLLAVISLQYRKLSNVQPGYSYDRLVVVATSLDDDSKIHWLMDELRKLPEVESVASCCNLPFGSSGNNVFDDEWNEQLFNFADMYFVSEGYFDVMGVKIVEGQEFRKGQSQKRVMMVNQEFVRKMQTIAGLDGSIIGKQIVVSEHSETANDRFNIIGVFEDFRLGTPKDLQLRPMAFFFEEDECYFSPYQVMVRLHEMTPENVQKVNDLIDANMPKEEAYAQPFRSIIEGHLNDERNIRDSLTICSVVALIISLVGLLGYVADEVGRRRREMAIRRVLGATVEEVLMDLARDITLIAIPALAIGSLAAAYLSGQWLQNYAERIPLSPWLFIAAALGIYLLIISCVFIRSWRAATENPIMALHAN